MSTLVPTSSGLKMMRILLILSHDLDVSLGKQCCSESLFLCWFLSLVPFLVHMHDAIPSSLWLLSVKLLWCLSCSCEESDKGCCGLWYSSDNCPSMPRELMKVRFERGSCLCYFLLFVCDRVFCGTGWQWTYDPFISTSEKPNYAPSYFAYTCPSPPLFHTWFPGHHKVKWFPHHVVSTWTVAGGSQIPGITWLMQPSTWSNVPVTLYDGHCYPTLYIDTDTETWGLSIIHLIWSCRDLVSIPLNPVTVVMT